MNILLGVMVLAAIAVATALVLRAVPSAARAVLGDDPPGRLHTMDGLRGICATAVFIHHSIIEQAFCAGAPWAAPASNFDNFLGRGAVALFFMVSAYLFWGRLDRAGGRLAWQAFFAERLRRILPLYAVVTAGLLVIVGVETGWSLQVPLTALLQQALRWLLFGFFGFPDINGLPQTVTRLSVLWSLRFEWVFYFSLPIMGMIHARLKRPWVIYGIFIAIGLGGGGKVMFLYFAAGCLCVPILAGAATKDRFKLLWSWGGLACLAGFIWRFHGIEGVFRPWLLIPVFVAALLGHGPWSVLRWRPLRFLGRISYSIYLVHNPLLHLFIVAGIGSATYAHLAPLQLYGVVALVGMGLIGISTMTYLLVEKPCLAPATAASASTVTAAT